MNNNADKMIAALTPEIEKKCVQLQEARKMKAGSQLFILLCIAVIVIPTVFVFFGLSLIALIIPVVFMAVSLLILSPILINQQGGCTYERA